MRVSAILMSFIAVLLGGIHVADLQGRERLLTLHYGDLRKAAQLINEGYNPKLAGCSYAGNSDDLDRLVLAIATVESFATPRLERFVENALVRIVLPLGVVEPDFSLGAGQIRPSTVEKALANLGRSDFMNSSNSRHMAYSLLEVCSNLRLLRLVVTNILNEQQLSSTRFDRKIITSVAQKYNGQAESSSVARGFSNVVYNELVFNLFQLNRFQSLPTASIGIERPK